MTDSINSEVDRARDVFVASVDLKIKFAYGRKTRAMRSDVWNVFLGVELIDHFDDREDAVELARKVSIKSGRPAWVTTDGVTFDMLEGLAVRR